MSDERGTGYGAGSLVIAALAGMLGGIALTTVAAVGLVVAMRAQYESRELDVQLPTNVTAMPLTVKPKEIFLEINAKGEYKVDGRTMSADELETFLAQAGAANPVSQSVIIRSDKSVPLEAAVKAMDLCNRARITDYQITTAGEPQ